MRQRHGPRTPTWPVRLKSRPTAPHERPGLDRPPCARNGGRTQPASLPPPQSRPGLGHPRHARGDRARSRQVALDRGAPARRSGRGRGLRRTGASRPPGGGRAVRASRLRDLAVPARRRAGRCTSHTGDRDDVHDPAPDHRLRRRWDLVGARANDQHREIGLLKAAGFTPRQVGTVFALESAALGFVAATLGFALGTTLAPRVAAPSARRCSVRRRSRRIHGASSSRAVSSSRCS